MSPLKVDPAIASEIVKAAMDREETLRQNPPELGGVTDLHCGCGALLHRTTLPPFAPIGKPKFSKNRRIRKKQMKRWAKENRFSALLHAVASFARYPMGFICASCPQTTGFYQAIGRNVFHVEPMPPGALPHYLKP